jgi:hypothetical protein
MAQFEHRTSGDLDGFLRHLDSQVLGGSVSASREASYDEAVEGARMAVRVYERFSGFSGSRVSLNVSVLESNGQLAICAITSGGSRAMFFKMDTVGEGSFMAKAQAAITSYSG